MMKTSMIRRPKGKVVKRNFRLTVSNGRLKGRYFYCGDVIGATISFDKFKQMVMRKLRSMGVSSEIIVQIIWDNYRIECELDFFEMWMYAVEDKDGFVTLGVRIIGGGIRCNINVLLDNDVLENILFRLPLGAGFSQAKRVCKSWKTILSKRLHNKAGFLLECHDKNNQKIQLYFGEEYDHIDVNKMNYYYSHETLMEMEHCSFALKENEDDILVGSCSGLVCFKKEDEPFAICNPLTGEFIFLKANFSRVWDEQSVVSSGFGYCQSTKKYMVVRLYIFDNEKPLIQAQVYTIGRKEWRDMEINLLTDDFDHRHHQLASSPGIFANGFLHWLNIYGNYIIAFDLEYEMFEELPLPPSEVLKRQDSQNELKLLGGNLCWVQDNRTHIDIWAYKRNSLNTDNEESDDEDSYYDEDSVHDEDSYYDEDSLHDEDSYYDKDEKADNYHQKKADNYHQKKGGNYFDEDSWNWVKEFTIENCGGNYRPFEITKSNEVLLLGSNSFHCYDPKTQTISKLGDDHGMKHCSYIHAIPFTNSYVSLKNSGETWYGPGCSAVPERLCYVSFEEVEDAYSCRVDRSRMSRDGCCEW